MMVWTPMMAAGLVADNGLPISSDLLILLIFAAVSVIGGILQKIKGGKQKEEQARRRPTTTPPQRTAQRREEGAARPVPPRKPPERPPSRPEPARPASSPPTARPAPRREGPAAPYPRPPARPDYDLDELRRQQERVRRAEAEAERVRRQTDAARRALPTTTPAIEREASIEDIEELPPLGKERPAAHPGAVTPTLAREVADPLRRMLADRSGLQAGFVLSEILSPPLGLRERHLR